MYVMDSLGQAAHPGGVLPTSEVEDYRRFIVESWGNAGPFPFGRAPDRQYGALPLGLQQEVNRIAPGLGFRPMPESGMLDGITCNYLHRIMGPSFARRMGCPQIPAQAVQSNMQQFLLTPQQRSSMMPQEPSTPTPSPTPAPRRTSITKLPYCVPPPGACFADINTQDTVKTQAQFGYKPDRGMGPCRSSEPRISSANVHMFDPERVKDLPLCSAMPPVTRPPTPVPAPEPDIEPELDDVPSGAPPPEGILPYKNLYWGQPPGPRVAELIRTQLNPMLVAHGYKPLDESLGFTLFPCAAIQALYPPEIVRQFQCQKLPNPASILKRPKSTSGWGLGRWGLGQTEAEEVVAKYSGIRRGEISSRVEELVLNYINPGLEAAGYLPITHHTERRRFAYRVCAALRFLYGDEVFSQFDCRDEEPSDWLRAVTPPPEPAPAPPADAMPSSDAPTTVYSDELPPTIYDELPPTIYDDPPTIYDEPPPTIYDEPELQPFQETTEETAETDEGQTKMVVGLLVALAVGGGAVYFMTRKKKR